MSSAGEVRAAVAGSGASEAHSPACYAEAVVEDDGSDSAQRL